MKRFLKIISVMFVVMMVVVSATSVHAETRYMSGAFKFGRYSPVVRIRHKVYTNWALQQQKNDSVSWCAKMYEDRDSQLFVIIPTKNTGYYAFEAVDNPQLFLTYNPSNGRFTMSPATEKPDYDGGAYLPGDTQKFKIEWCKSCTTAYNIKVTNAYRLRCRKTGKLVSFCGWCPIDLQQINAS